MRRLDGVPDSMDMGLSELQETAKDGEPACCSHGVTQSQAQLSR